MSVDYRVPAQTHIGHVHLKVSDLERSITFYRDVMGFDAAYCAIYHDATTYN